MPRSKIRVYLHCIWATWDRAPVINPDIERELHRSISAVCTDINCQPYAIGGIEDHVHLLVSVPATITIAELMKRVKGASSNWAGKLLGDPEAFRWQGGYGCFSVGHSELERVINYVRKQKEHHASGNLDLQLEEMLEDV